MITNRIGDEPQTVAGSGSLIVDGVTYDFTPTTCLISDEDFVAAGTGFDGPDRFWVSASSVGLDLSVGTENEVDEPAVDQLWLISEEVTDWQASGQTVTARAPMVDRRSPQSTTLVGSLHLRCEDA